MGIQRLIVKLARVQKTLRRRSDWADLGRAQLPNTTACMMRPGAKVWCEKFQQVSAERSGNAHGFGPKRDPIVMLI